MNTSASYFPRSPERRVSQHGPDCRLARGSLYCDQGNSRLWPGRHPRPGDLKTRLEAKSIPEPNSGCWIWIGALRKGDYGQIVIDGKKKLAHRISYEIHKGPIPEGMELDHICRMHQCINPDHLEAVSHRVNVLRGAAPSAVHAAKTHCSKGHEFSASITINGKVRRHCKICKRITQRAWESR